MFVWLYCIILRRYHRRKRERWNRTLYFRVGASFYRSDSESEDEGVAKKNVYGIHCVCTHLWTPLTYAPPPLTAKKRRLGREGGCCCCSC